jgi:Tol biopolymer transport system component
MNHRFRIRTVSIIFVVIILVGVLLYTGVFSQHSPSDHPPALNHSNAPQPDLDKGVTEVEPPPKKKSEKQDFAISSRIDGNVDWMSDIEDEATKLAEFEMGTIKRLSSLPPVRDKAEILFTRDNRFGHLDVSLSADARLAAFVEIQNIEAKSAIMVHSLEDNQYINVTQGFGNAEVMHPSISPDGRSVVFRENEVGIWMVDLETKSPTLVIDKPGAYKPSFSPDGRYLTYNLVESNARCVGFEVYDLEQKRVVKSYPGERDTSVYYASVSPDGKYLLYKRQVRRPDGGRERSLILESFDTGEKQTLSIPHPEFGYARMSPDGQYIAYSAVDSTTGCKEVFCFSLKDQTTTGITSGNGQSPVWVGDSAARLAFMSSRETGVSGIYVIDTTLENEQ